MPLNAAEKVDLSKAFLQCFGEDYNTCGRTLAYMRQFTVGQVDLVAEVKNQATTWPPFVASGLSVEDWKNQLQRQYDQTLAGMG
jgi:hypothetical protein